MSWCLINPATCWGLSLPVAAPHQLPVCWAKRLLGTQTSGVTHWRLRAACIAALHFWQAARGRTCPAAFAPESTIRVLPQEPLSAGAAHMHVTTTLSGAASPRCRAHASHAHSHAAPQLWGPASSLRTSSLWRSTSGSAPWRRQTAPPWSRWGGPLLLVCLGLKCVKPQRNLRHNLASQTAQPQFWLSPAG